MSPAFSAIRITVNQPTKPFEGGGATVAFARWAIATMQTECSDHAVSPSGPADHQTPRDATIPSAGMDEELDNPVEAVNGDFLLERAVDYLSRSSSIHHATAEHQPGNVFDLTDKLFAPYDLDDVRISLAGCTLEDRPLLRLTSLVGSQTSGNPAQLEHFFLHPDGQPVAEQWVEQLMLHEIRPYRGKPPRLRQAELESWVELASQQLDLSGDRRLLTVTVIWCKHAAGKIRFRYGDETQHVSFAGWAHLFATGQAVLPPFRCSHTQAESYHVRHTDEGLITVQPSLAVCQSSGATVLVNQTELCAVTGQRVLPKFLQTCPVSAHRILPSHAVACSMCSQQVSPEVMKGCRCAACRRLQPISKEDPRLARLVTVYPGLDQWPHWRVSELAEFYLFVGNTLLKEILLVIEKEGLRPRHVATAGRILGKWSRTDPDQFDQYLR